MLASSDEKVPSDWSADGRFLSYSMFSMGTQGDVWVLPLDAKPFPFVQTALQERRGVFSPDGRWIAYTTRNIAEDHVYVQDFAGTSKSTGKWQISTTGGNQPLWRRDGKELFYLAPDRKLMAVEIRAGATFEAGAPRPLFQTRYNRADDALLARSYAVSADGQRFLINSAVDQAALAPLTVWLHWTVQPKR